MSPLDTIVGLTFTVVGVVAALALALCAAAYYIGEWRRS